MVQNKSLVYKKVPTGKPVAGEHLVIEDRPFDVDQAPPAGGFTAKVHYVSFDPYQRGRMRAPEVKSYAPPYSLDAPVTNTAIVTILKSDKAGFEPGQLALIDRADTSEYVAIRADHAEGNMRVLDNTSGVDPKEYLGTLGMPGLTAYSSYYDIGEPKKGETIFISAASGAVGQVVGQLAKHDGLTVIGSVGDDKKLEYITEELGFDAGFNYKTEKPSEALARLAPDGIDIYYDNVGGEHLEAAITAMKTYGRVVACGMISQYNTPPDKQYAIRNLTLVVGRRIKIQGFIVLDRHLGPKYAKEHVENVGKWIKDGSFKTSNSVTVGIDNAAHGLLALFDGGNFGKAILEVSKPESS